ncbi:adenosine receptor A2b-like [Actinia tenebrosa]|uniref:Adenosine receptor A2b-like n=1 Tax=Actinia tenebrosa TaxID=6105 RepID=A0A6P8HF65_ACTTE|nr:adenosine receptor A2b-like [Actinia tenebrosa]
MTSSNISNNSSVLLPLTRHDVFLPRNGHGDTVLLVMIVINAVMAVVASCSNAVVIYTISRTPSLQTPSNILILGLAISDFSLGVFAQPFLIVRLFAQLEYNPRLYRWCNVIFLASGWSLSVVSILTLTMVIADRFLAIHLHLRYQELITTKRHMIILGIIWLVSPWFGAYNGMHDTDKAFRYVYIASLSLLTTLNGYFILNIHRAIRRHSVQIQVNTVGQDMPRHKKSVKIMYFMTGAFVLCYGPYSAILVARQIVPKMTLIFNFCILGSTTLLMFNSVLNPIIYFWRIEEMRNAALVLLQKTRRCWHMN